MKYIIVFLGLFSIKTQAQEHAWVYFKDKPNALNYLNNPLLMLSQRALDRRVRQNISLDVTDVPLEQTYLSLVENSTGIALKASSKWMNAVHVYGSQTNITNLKNANFVDSIQFADKNIGVVKKQMPLSRINKLNTNIDYGFANNQNTMTGVEKFHNQDYKGQGYQIALMDGGFLGVNTAKAFAHLLDTNQTNGEILGGYDFVNQSSSFYANTGTNHGTLVLSTIAVIKENQFVGTAPQASFYLFVTEDANSETPLEESYWVQAAERADSLGVDILNTSLGYSQFDESKYNYTYSDMDGATTFITRGANIAADKGMVVITSAGNSGNSTWRYLTAPSDAKNSISVGAVNADESVTFFSSFGPSPDGRIKPETLAQGGNVFVVDEHNTVKTSNGTSFSAPIVSGVVACLWQAYPNKTNLEIRQMVIANSKDFLNPTNQGGYGVLNVDNIPVLSTKDISNPSIDFSIVYPLKKVQFSFDETMTYYFHLQVFSVLGNVVVDKQITNIDNTFSFANLSSGLYCMRLNYQDKNQVKMIVIP